MRGGLRECGDEGNHEGRLGGWNVHNNTTTKMSTQAGKRMLMIISPFAGPPFKQTRMLSDTHADERPSSLSSAASHSS